MPEKLIPLEPDKFYHIYNHAIGKENFFETDADYLWFLNKLKKYVVPLCDIYSFCLMANHFHFVLRIKSEIEIKNILNKLNTGRLSVEERMAKDETYLSNAVSQQMGNLFNAYAKYFNYVHQRKGTLFTRAFRRKWVEKRRLLKAVNLLCASKPGSGRICCGANGMEVFILQCNCQPGRNAGLQKRGD